MPPAPDYWLKYHRAKKHLRDLHACTDDWLASPDHVAANIAPDPPAPDTLIVRVTADPIPVDPLSLIVGDVVHNFRCCLDQQVFALATHYAKPHALDPQIAADSQFPIVGNVNRLGDPCVGADSFQSQRKSIRGLKQAAQDLIESHQPFARGAAFADDPLWHLATLSNHDKHRVIHFATSCYARNYVLDPPSRLSRGTLRVAYGGVYPLTFGASGMPVGVATEVARITTRPLAPGEQWGVDLEIRPSIAFATGPLAHEDVRELLEGIEAGVAAVVTDLDKLF
jgi:hypothetical protein